MELMFLSYNLILLAISLKIYEKNNLKYDSISVKPKKATDNQLGHIEINIQTLKDKI